VERVKADPPSRLTGFIGHVLAVFTHHVDRERLRTMSQSQIPITILTGTNDLLVHHSNSYYLNEILTPAEFIVWEGAGHGVAVEKFAEFNEALIRNFKRGHEGFIGNTPTESSL